MYKIYGISNCNKCREALKFFSDKASFHDLRDQPISEKRIKFFISILGESLLNKNSQTWRSLSNDDKALRLIDLLSKYPLLIKRPLIERNNIVTAGWSAEIIKRLSD